MDIKVYSKPNIIQSQIECAKWPRCAIVASMRPEVAWTDIVSEKTMLSKSVTIHANKEKVWELIGDPNKIPVYDEGVVEIDWINKDLLKVKDVFKTGEGSFKTQEFTVKVLRNEPPNLIQYEMGRDGHEEFFTFSIEGQPKGRTCIFTLQFDSDFALANPRDVEFMLEKISVNIARLSTDKETFKKMVKEFKSPNLKKTELCAKQSIDKT
ncbi:MAG: SRPBCC family protein [Desulfobacteraceae bacterium]|nr:SRPBCC family protein [Desulfobacteraceae bacterium]